MVLIQPAEFQFFLIDLRMWDNLGIAAPFDMSIASFWKPASATSVMKLRSILCLRPLPLR